MTRSGTEISIVIATHNRAGLLVGALQSLAEQTLDTALFEIVVVDNGSTDETPEVVTEFRLAHPNLQMKLISEKRLGLGRARNAGDKHAKGQFVAFLDDDARAERDWLEKALRCFSEINPTPLAVGGPILPFYLAPKPDWFKDEYEIRSWGDEPRFLNRWETFSGSNMIFAKEVIRDHGSFSDRFGMKGERLSVGEETALFEEIWRRNSVAPLHYSPDLIVRHAVPAHRMTTSYALKRALIEGQTWNALHASQSHLGRGWYIVSHVAPDVFGSFARSLFHLRRYDHYQNWIVEDFSRTVGRLGILLSCLGINVPVRRAQT
jgi:glycosyltransferase involved in cell wall biosynthesis